MTRAHVLAGAVAGLVGITPGAGFVTPMWSLFIGAVAALSVFFVPQVVRRFHIDDRLDTFAFHGVGGIAGTLLTGLFATTSVNSGGYDGAFYGNPLLLGKQAASVAFTVAYSVIATSIIYWILLLLSRLLKVDLRLPNEESYDADKGEHGQKAYELHAPHEAAASKSHAVRKASNTTLSVNAVAPGTDATSGTRSKRKATDTHSTHHHHHRAHKHTTSNIRVVPEASGGEGNTRDKSGGGERTSSKARHKSRHHSSGAEGGGARNGNHASSSYGGHAGTSGSGLGVGHGGSGSDTIVIPVEADDSASGSLLPQNRRYTGPTTREASGEGVLTPVTIVTADLR